MASPTLRPKMLTAMESRFVTGIVPRSANFRGATKRRWRESVVKSRIATSSILAPKAPATYFTTRSDMSRNNSSGLSVRPLFSAIA